MSLEEPTAPPIDEERDPLVGQTLAGLYRVEALIGSGGIGKVYRAEHMALRRPVALKVLLEAYQKVDNLKQRFEREATTLARLSHPNIVTILDFRSIGRQTFLVMELVDGAELSELIQVGPLPPPKAYDVMRQILRCLAYAHSEGVIHRDLKPANVIVRQLCDDSDHVEVLDFGLAKAMDNAGPSAELTRSGLVLGTPAYMAPEQGSGGRADARSDVYAAGLLFFEMLAGRRPFDSEDPAELIRAHLVTEPPSLPEVSPHLAVPPELDAFVRRALAKAPAERFADGLEMLRAFDALPVAVPRAPGSEIVAPPSRDIGFDATRQVRTPSHASPSGAPVTPRRWSRLAGVALALFFVAGASGVLAWQLAVGGRPAGAESAGTVTSTGPAVSASGGAAFDLDPEGPEVEVDEGAAADDEGGEVGVGDPLAAPDELALEDAAEAPAPLPPSGERPAARNPWQGRVPGTLSRVRNRLRRGQVPSTRQLRPLREYRRQHPGDIRGPLLVAHIYSARGWLTAATEQYVRVYRRDPAVRGDPRMQRDLVRFVRFESVHPAALDAVVEIYGAGALGQVGAELERTADAAERARLEALQSRLRALGPPA